MRLNKYLAENGGVSRREADLLIEKGAVTVNGKKARLGQQIEGNEQIICSGKTVKNSAKVYLMLHKPVGYVCSRKEYRSPTVYRLLPRKFHHLKNVGRLDCNSSGLLLFTNDGDFAFRMTHPRFAKTKVYLASLDADLTEAHRRLIAEKGVLLSDGKSRLQLTPVSKNTRKDWRVEMSEGRNRQIRRTFAELGYTVLKLHRIAFGDYRLGDLPEGEWRELQI